MKNGNHKVCVKFYPVWSLKLIEIINSGSLLWRCYRREVLLYLYGRKDLNIYDNMWMYGNETQTHNHSSLMSKGRNPNTSQQARIPVLIAPPWTVTSQSPDGPSHWSQIWKDHHTSQWCSHFQTSLDRTVSLKFGRYCLPRYSVLTSHSTVITSHPDRWRQNP